MNASESWHNLYPHPFVIEQWDVEAMERECERLKEQVRNDVEEMMFAEWKERQNEKTKNNR